MISSKAIERMREVAISLLKASNSQSKNQVYKILHDTALTITPSLTCNLKMCSPHRYGSMVQLNWLIVVILVDVFQTYHPEKLSWGPDDSGSS